MKIKPHELSRNIELWYDNDTKKQTIIAEADKYGWTLDHGIYCSLWVKPPHDFDATVAHFQAMGEPITDPIVSLVEKAMAAYNDQPDTAQPIKHPGVRLTYLETGGKLDTPDTPRGQAIVLLTTYPLDFCDEIRMELAQLIPEWKSR